MAVSLACQRTAPDRLQRMVASLIDGLVLVLVRTQGPVNLGLIARLCGNLGITEVRLVAPQCGLDDDDCRKFANHHRDFLARMREFARLEDALADCRGVVATSARERAKAYGAPLSLAQLPGYLPRFAPGPWALVFGNEADGLDDGELRQAHAWLHLDTPGTYSSYNLAMAVAIVGYRLAESAAPEAQARPVEEARPLPGATVEQLRAHWLGTAERIGAMRKISPQSYAARLDRFLRRHPLPQEDHDLLRGLLAQVHYRCFGDKGQELAHGWHPPDDSPDLG